MAGGCGLWQLGSMSLCQSRVGLGCVCGVRCRHPEVLPTHCPDLALPLLSHRTVQLRVHCADGGAGEGAVCGLEQAVWAGPGPERGAAVGRGAGRPQAA